MALACFTSLSASAICGSRETFFFDHPAEGFVYFFGKSPIHHQKTTTDGSVLVGDGGGAVAVAVVVIVVVDDDDNDNGGSDDGDG